MEILKNIWEFILTQTYPPDFLKVIIMFVFVFSIVWYSKFWKLTRNIITLIHEAGHAFVALFTGRRIDAIRLRADTSGVMESSSSTGGTIFGYVAGIFVTFAGYISASILGILGALMLNMGHPTLFLAIMLLCLILVLLKTRNLYGLFIVFVMIVLTTLILMFVPIFGQMIVVLFLTSLCLIGGMKPIIELYKSRKINNDGTDDVSRLAQKTLIPGIIWIGIYLILSIGLALFGLTLLFNIVIF